MTDYREDQVTQTLADYFAKRDAARANRVRAFLDSLTDRERALVQDIAVMGYVRGTMHSEGDRIPKSPAILSEVVDACFAFPDLYPAVATIEPCPRFPEGCPNLRAVPPNPPEHDGGVRCGCADDEEA
ncbi:hypothetical protein ACH4GZ_38625 [Streptomyces hygroscopicus]|uniref:hypothetical protein n=1 Tax=Streptomyces hygroscopicus TaxID=1912 RepID=UPI0037A1BEBD